jgi:hypothetical protein
MAKMILMYLAAALVALSVYSMTRNGVWWRRLAVGSFGAVLGLVVIENFLP